MSVSTLIQKTSVDTVGSVTVSAIVQDPNSGLYIRTITVNSPPDSGGNIATQFTLVLSATTVAAIELTSPANVF